MNFRDDIIYAEQRKKDAEEAEAAAAAAAAEKKVTLRKFIDQYRKDIKSDHQQNPVFD